MPFSHTRVVNTEPYVKGFICGEKYSRRRGEISSTRKIVGLQYGHHQKPATTTTIITITYNHVTTNYTATTSYSYAVFFCGPLSTAWKQRVLFFSEISSDQSMNKFDWTSWKSNETEFGFNLFSEKKIIRRKWEKKLQY